MIDDLLPKCQHCRNALYNYLQLIDAQLTHCQERYLYNSCLWSSINSLKPSTALCMTCTSDLQDFNSGTICGQGDYGSLLGQEEPSVAATLGLGGLIMGGPSMAWQYRFCCNLLTFSENRRIKLSNALSVLCLRINRCARLDAIIPSCKEYLDLVR